MIVNSANKKHVKRGFIHLPIGRKRIYAHQLSILLNPGNKYNEPIHQSPSTMTQQEESDAPPPPKLLASANSLAALIILKIDCPHSLVTIYSAGTELVQFSATVYVACIKILHAPHYMTLHH